MTSVQRCALSKFLPDFLGPKSYLFTPKGLIWIYNTTHVLGSQVSQCMTITLTHWGRVMHICFSKLNIIASDNDGLVAWPAPSHYLNQCWNIVNWTLRNKLQWNFNRIRTFSFKKIRLKVSSAKWQPCCLGLNVLKIIIHFLHWYPPADLLKLSGIYFFHIINKWHQICMSALLQIQRFKIIYFLMGAWDPWAVILMGPRGLKWVPWPH